MLVEFKVEKGSVISTDGSHVVIIKASGVALPVWIGPFEATAITLKLDDCKTSRPVTHELIKNVLTGIGMPVTKMVIGAMGKIDGEEIFLGSLFLKKGEGEISFDCRPSDGIALCLRFGVPMYIEQGLLMRMVDDERIKQALETIEQQIPSAVWQELNEGKVPDDE